MSDTQSDRVGGSDARQVEREPAVWPRFDVAVQSTVPTPWGRYGPSNRKRARLGRKVAKRFARKVGDRFTDGSYGSKVDRKDVALVVTALACGLLHYAHQAGEDPAALLERVGRAFESDFEDEEFRPGECSPILRRFDSRDPRARARA